MAANTSPPPSAGSSSVGPDRHNPQSPHFDPSKRHVINRACDICRRRKVRCDGAQAADGRSCAYCIKHGIECTYNQLAPVRRGPSKAYVTHLEHKIDRLKELLEQACPGIDVNEELEAESPPGGRSRRPSPPYPKKSPALPPSPPSSITNLHIDNVSSKSARLFRDSSLNDSVPRSPAVTLVNSPPTVQSPSGLTSSSDELDIDQCYDAGENIFARYHGESSEVVFTLAASELKPTTDASKKMFKIDDTGVALPDSFPRRRPQFWMSSKWEVVGAEYFD
ncbi:hypothetical protein FS749_000340, partial [Ceratobasidium sp. UAMH 11750]